MTCGGPRSGSIGPGPASSAGPKGASRPGMRQLDVRALEQGRTWVGPDGTVRRVRDLPYSEASALRDDLRAHEDLLYAMVLRREVAARLLALTLAPPEGRQAPRPWPGTSTGAVPDAAAGSVSAAGGATAARATGAAVPGPAARVAADPAAVADLDVEAVVGGWPELSTRARVRVWGALGRGPRVWLESTPLMRSLQRQLGRGPSRGREPS